MLAMSWARFVSLAALLATPACSLIYDFSNPISATDAGADAVAPAAECELGEPNNTFASATPLLGAVGGPAAICTVGDVDFYAFTINDATTTTTVTIGFLSAMGDLDARVLASDGTTISVQGNSFGDNEVMTCPSVKCPAFSPGLYYLSVYGATGSELNRYTIAVEQQ